MASWRDMSTPLNPSPAAAPPSPAPAAPSSAPKSGGGGWRDQSTPLAPAPAPTPAAVAAPAPAPATSGASSDIAQPDDTLGNMSWFDPRAANSTTKDFLLAHLGELGKGLGQMGGAADDYARVASNTYGLGDRLASYMGGTDLADERAKTAAASARLGTAGTIAASMTGGGPLGEVAGAVKGALPIAGRFAGPLAGAITGGAATTAGEAGRGESLSPWDIGIGTVKIERAHV